MRIYFLLILVALAITVACSAALAWDGSYYFFKILDTQTPYAPFGRITNVPLHWFVLLSLRVTGNLAITRLVFSAVHAIVPLAALAASWWVTRRDDAPLFVWAAFGICLATLPGQFGLTSEGIEVVQLFWPILLALLVRMPSRHLPLMAVLIPADFFFHPAAAALMALGAGVALLVALFSPRDWLRMCCWAVVLGALAVVRFLMIRSGYESGQLSPATQTQAFKDGLAGLPLAALCCALAAAVMIAAPTFFSRTLSIRTLRALHAGPYIVILCVGALLIPWARDPGLWMGGISFKDWALPCSLPFMFLAILEGTFGREYLRRREEYILRPRMRFAQAVAWVFLVVLYLQGRVFVDSSAELTTTMAQTPLACISMQSLPQLYRTALNNWALPAYAVDLQSRTPRTLVLAGDECTRARLTGQVQLISFDSRTSGNGWFNLDAARSRLAAPADCWFGMSPGWYATEANATGWWRWSAGHGDVRLFSAQAWSAVLRGQLATIQQPRQVEIVVNGKALATLTAAPGPFRPFAPVTIPLHAGTNLIEFLSRDPAVRDAGDRRLLAMGVKNLTITGASVCQLQS